MRDFALRWTTRLANQRGGLFLGNRQGVDSTVDGKAPKRMGARRGLVLLAILALSFRSPGQDLRYMRHQSWSTEQGLPQDSVHQILQTSDGFLWLATEAGVARFDGLGFQVFDRHNEAAFASDDTCCLAEDRSGNLLIGTANGLVVKGRQSFRLVTEKDGFPSATVESLAVQPDGSVLVRTARGTAVWAANGFKAEGSRPVLASPPEPGVATTPVHAAGQGWSYSDGLLRVRQAGLSRQWTIGKELPGSKIETLFLDRRGTAWVGTNRGLMTIPKGSSTAMRVPWLDGNVVLQVYEDREGNDWIGTETSGLHVLRRLKFRGDPELADQAISAVVQSGPDRLWIGTPRDGLRLLQATGQPAVIPAQKLTSAFILSLAPGLHGSVWAGTPDGLNHVAPDGSVQQTTSADGLPDDYARALASDAEGGVWVGTRRGLAHVRDGRITVLSRANGLASDLVGVLLRTSKGDVWAGTSGGLSRCEPDGKITGFEPGPQGAGGIVTALAEDNAGSLWVGTSTGAIGRFAAGAFQWNAFPNAPRVLGLAVDEKGFVWLRNEQGIDGILRSRLEQCLLNKARCALQRRHYAVADGLPSVEVTPDGSPVLWRTAGGELWFATRRGVAITDPDHLALNPVPPPVAIKRFMADDVALNTATPDLRIPFGHLRFTIDYAGLSFVAPSEVRYRYKLEGLDADWIDAGGRRSATYTNLRPNQYRFRVQAVNNDGVWNEAGGTLLFRIVPPFYRRWWFLALLAVAVAAAVVGAYRLRLQHLQTRFDAVLGERNRMAREIHDTLAQDFVGVSLQLDIVHQLLAAKKVEPALEQVQQTRKLVTEGLAEARQSIWELRANLAEDSLPTRLSRLVERYSSSALSIQLRIGGAYRPLDPRLEAEVLRIAQEALSNVQRHSGATQGSVHLHYRSDMLVLTVQDQGRGFALDDAMKMEGHYGLAGMRERAESLRSTLEIDAAPGRGTTITLSSAIAGTER